MEELTKKEIMEQLDTMGVEYDSSDKKAELEKLLMEKAPYPSKPHKNEGEEVEADTAPAELSGKVTGVQSADVEIVQFGALMKLDVIHDGIEYAKGEAVDLGDEATYDLFKQNGWIE